MNINWNMVGNCQGMEYKIVKDWNGLNVMKKQNNTIGILVRIWNYYREPGDGELPLFPLFLRADPSSLGSMAA